ncbi:MAG TPA: hypothetical protein VJ869_07005 [Sphaerochaeta sp.]|nr:hypothetical protein [Sphaerochaeta sp.]
MDSVAKAMYFVKKINSPYLQVYPDIVSANGYMTAMLDKEAKHAKDAVHNAVVLEEVAKMAYRCEMLNPKVQPAAQQL